MTRLLRELDRADARAYNPRTRRPGDAGRRLAAVFAATALIVVVGGGFAHKKFGLTVDRHGFHLAAPLGRPPALTGESGVYAFMATQQASDLPVTYDPCEPIEYVVNDAMAPPGSEGLLASALAEISSATGLRFVAAGRTDEPPPSSSAMSPPRREPVYIGWSTPEVVNDLAGRVAGVGGSTARFDEFSGQLEYVTGMVALDAPQLTKIMASPSGADHARAIIVHELGHLVGLAHVDDPDELMYADNVGRLDLGPGDRRGLVALGSGRCIH